MPFLFTLTHLEIGEGLHNARARSHLHLTRPRPVGIVTLVSNGKKSHERVGRKTGQ